MNQTPNIDLLGTCACVPYGTVEPAKTFRNSSKRVARLGTLPVLTGGFSSSKTVLDANAPSHLGLGSLDTEGELPILAIRLQIGADMLYWLANAADPAIWAMLDAWHAAGRMAVAAKFDNGRMLFVDKEFMYGPAVRALRQRVALANLQTSTREFMQSAGEALLSGELASRATSDIPSVASLRHVQGCTVCTETTGRILVPLEVAVSSACDLLIPESLARLVPPRQPVH